MPYCYRCRYHDFGCDVTRTKKEGIVLHSKRCQYAKFEKYLKALKEVEDLRNRVRELELAPRRGRAPIVVTPADWRLFEAEFSNNQLLIEAWKELANTPRNGMRAMITIFVNLVPRFFKLRSLNEIDVNIWLPSLRTNGFLERHTMESFADDLVYAASGFIERDHEKFHFGKLEDYKIRASVASDKTFIFNTFSRAAKRKNGEKIRFENRSIADVFSQNHSISDDLKTKILSL